MYVRMCVCTGGCPMRGRSGVWLYTKTWCRRNCLDRGLANITLELEVKKRICYTSKSLESKYQYRIGDENANLPFQQIARKQIPL